MGWSGPFNNGPYEDGTYSYTDETGATANFSAKEKQRLEQEGKTPTLSSQNSGGGSMSNNDILKFLMSTSKSEQGLPSSMENVITGLFGGGGSMGWAPQQMWGQNMQNLTAFDKVPEYADQIAGQQDNMFRRQLANPLQQAMNSMTRNAAGRGAMSSSVMNRGISDIASNMFRSAQDQADKSQLWASNAKLGNIKDKFSAGMQGTGMLGDWLGLTRRGSSSSITPTNPFGLFLGGANGNTGLK